MIDWAVAWIVNDNKLLLIKNKKHQLWLAPGGHIEQGETPMQGVTREVKEEVNLDIELVSFNQADIGATHYQPLPFAIRHKKEVGYEYIATTTNPEHVELQEDEIEDYRWFTREELEHFDDAIPGIKKKGNLVLRFMEKFNQYQ